MAEGQNTSSDSHTEAMSSHLGVGTLLGKYGPHIVFERDPKQRIQDNRALRTHTRVLYYAQVFIINLHFGLILYK